MNKTILIPANPFRKFLGGQDEGSIEAHDKKIREEGSVYWRLRAPGNWVAAEFPHAEIRNGYLYDGSIKKVTHTCDISWIRPMSGLSFEDSNKYFLENFQSQDHFREVAELFYVLKITDIRPLDQPIPLSEFRKYNNGEPVKLVRNYCIVQNLGGEKPKSQEPITPKHNDPRPNNYQMNINVKETDQPEDRMADGVIFYYEKAEHEKRIPVAFLKDYEWLHGKPKCVDVLLFELDPSQIAEAELEKDQIVEEVLRFVKEFLESKGTRKSRGYVTTHWNA